MKNFIPTIHNRETVSLPVGEYYVGDPCYVFPDDDWADFIMGTDVNGIHEFNGKPSLVVNTHGDGSWEYNDSVFGVDSGMLAVVPVELLDNKIDLTRHGVVVEITEETEVGYITDDYSFFEIFAGQVTIQWNDFDNEQVAERAFEYAEYEIITTVELYEALMEYVKDEDEIVIQEIKEALPQFN